jgi:hypothetical protein
MRVAIPPFLLYTFKAWCSVKKSTEATLPLPYHRVQTGSEAHPASYPMGSGGSFSGCKVAGA